MHKMQIYPVKKKISLCLFCVNNSFFSLLNAAYQKQKTKLPEASGIILCLFVVFQVS